MEPVIVRNPAILSGEPVSRGTRVPFKALTDYLALSRSRPQQKRDLWIGQSSFFRRFIESLLIRFVGMVPVMRQAQSLASGGQH